MKKIIHFSVVLLVISGSAGIGLHGVNELTKDRIAAAQRKNLADGQKIVFPGAASFSDEMKFPLNGSSGTYYEVYNEKKELVGYELLAAEQGYQSQIRVLTGVGKDGVVTGIKVLEQAETPGLGTEVDALPGGKSLWQALAGIFSTAKVETKGPVMPPFQAQYAGKKAAQLEVVKMHDPNKIDAISGATITSKAVTRAVRTPLEAFLQFKNISTAK